MRIARLSACCAIMEWDGRRGEDVDVAMVDVSPWDWCIPVIVSSPVADMILDSCLSSI